MIEHILDYSQIIIADLILSGDNALIIGLAAAGLAPEMRKRAIFYGMLIAAVLRIIFAVIATELLDVKGLLFAGGLLLTYVCYRLYHDIRDDSEGYDAAEKHQNGLTEGVKQRTMASALISITIADVSMSLDNVLAVAAIAAGDTQKLVFGLGLAIVLMAFCATIIMKILARYPIISWLGLAVLIYVSVRMLYEGFVDQDMGIGPMLGIIEGWPIHDGDHGHHGGHDH